MKKGTLCFAFFASIACATLADNPPSGYWAGDINSSSVAKGNRIGDEADAAKASITMSDLVMLIDICRGVRPVVPAADVDGDKVVTIDDILMLVDILFGNCKSVWCDYSIVVDGYGGIGSGGDAGDNPPPVDSKERNNYK